MNNGEVIYKEITKVLDDLVHTLSSSEFVKYKTEHDVLKAWVYKLNLPNEQEELFYFLLPKIDFDSSSDIPYDISKSTYYVIDCFRKFGKGERTLSPRKFFEFLFDIKGYNNFFEKDTIFHDIEKLYTTRTITFFNSVDELGHERIYDLETLLTDWQNSAEHPLLILGERGIGKSWTVLNYCYRNIRLHIEEPWIVPLPIYINLRSLAEDVPGLTNLGELIFYTLSNNYRIKLFSGYSLFLVLLKLRKIILVLDGLDEISKEVSSELTLKNLWQIFSIYSQTTKFILTSRLNFFSSRTQIKEHFAYQSFIKQQLEKTSYKSKIYSREERRIRQDFNVWEIKPFEAEEKHRLLQKAANINDAKLQDGIQKLERLSKFSEHTVQFELFQLSNTPAYFLIITSFLATGEFKSLIDIYEECINAVNLQFNIESDRAINKYKTLEKNRVLKGHEFDIEQKNEILRKLAWYMIERDIFEFDIIEFPKFIREIEDIDFEIVLNDLQTQTVITLKEEHKYSFISDSIFAFYVANHLFLSLVCSDEQNLINGIQNIGLYDFTQNQILDKAKIFLKAKFEALRKRKIGSERINLLIQKIEEVFICDRPYSPWLKNLSSNLNLIGLSINTKVLSLYDFWKTAPISNHLNKVDKRMVLVPGDFKEGIEPFFLGITEVTNQDYYNFLQSNEFDGNDNDEECLGHFWQRKEAFAKNSNVINPYLEIINYYHIIFWTDDKIPVGKYDHPIVWISWFAAAKFCNWLSRKENLPLYYIFNFEKGKFIDLEINNSSYGYRLPKEYEWKFAARGGDSKAKTILDTYKEDKEKQKVKRKFSEHAESTSSVKSENPNKYGVYGLMGNVREWVDNPIITPLNKYSQQIIKGMGWLLGQEGFDFDHSSFLIAQNNNVDVGFRVARSLTVDETKRVKVAYINNKQG